MTMTARTLLATLATAALLQIDVPAAAQEPLAEVSALYASAAYEDALATLARLDPATASRGEAGQFRAYCLIALGRTEDAERAIEAVVAADPLFVPPAGGVSPRILAMFTDVRRRLIPDLARQLYAEGRRAFQAKDFATATTQFDRVMQMIDRASPGTAQLEDLHVLVAGFIDLARANAETASRVATAPETAATPVTAAPRTSTRGEGYTAPVVVYQEVPPWNPPNAVLAGRAYSGAVKVVIGADGHVLDASVTKPVHPLYDAVLLQAARRWTYRPATRFGEPTTAEKVVEVRLTPR